MPITDHESWNKFKLNNQDSYGGACIKVAEEVMRLLDEDDTPLHEGYHPDPHTPHGLICLANENSGARGITGFMAGAVASMVSQCHSRGEEFRRVWNRECQINDEGDKANEESGVLNGRNEMIESGDNTINLSAYNSGCGITIGDGSIWSNGKRIDKTYQPKSYSWNPQEDITTYELALCLPVLLMSIHRLPVETQINDLPENCRRHFEEE